VEIPEHIKELINLRTQARKEKNWAAADKFRDQIAEMGFEIEDTAQGTTICK